MIPSTCTETARGTSRGAEPGQDVFAAEAQRAEPKGVQPLLVRLETILLFEVGERWILEGPHPTELLVLLR